MSIEIIGGMAAPPPDSSEPDEQDDGDKRYGWYIACNGRIVLAADKTVISGWGTDEWPMWHRQYSGFLGLILFTGVRRVGTAFDHNQTKCGHDVRGLPEGSPTHAGRNAENESHYTNTRKQALEEAKAKRREGGLFGIDLLSFARLDAVKLPAL